MSNQQIDVSKDLKKIIDYFRYFGNKKYQICLIDKKDSIEKNLTERNYQGKPFIYLNNNSLDKNYPFLRISIKNAIRRINKLVSNTENREKCPVVIDVRTQREWEEGHLSCAHRLPVQEDPSLLEKVACLAGGRGEGASQVQVYCRSGRRSGIAVKILENDGFTDVVNAGGYLESLKKNLCNCVPKNTCAEIDNPDNLNTKNLGLYTLGLVPVNSIKELNDLGFGLTSWNEIQIYSNTLTTFPRKN